MLRKFKLNFLIYGCWLFCSISPILTLSSFAEQSSKINLTEELKKGNFLIGLKQYLGVNSDNFSKKNNITFTTKNDFLKLHSINGLIHKSKKINIVLKKKTLKTPFTVERLVFGPFASYESARKQAEKLKEKGYEALVAFPKNWEVWIPVGKNLPDKKLNYKLFKKSYKSAISPFLVTEYSERELQGPIYISSSQEIRINDINFGKKFYLAKDSYGTWTLIQKIKFDEYLKGVLPHEIGSNSPLEALKAQAVIARTWALYNSDRFKIDKYHLCVTTQCQVYETPVGEYKNVNKAIEDTSNLIITYKQKPINSFYHGSNGGISASASESWQIKDYSYLNSMVDGLDSLKKGFKLPIKSGDKLNKFFEFADEKVYGNKHSLFRWEKILSNETIQNHLLNNQLIDEKSGVVDLDITNRGFSGRVIKLEIKLKNLKKPIVLVKDDIRRILSFLPSNLFTINKLNDNLWLFKGGGFGHGVGLSQSGAIEMAELGFTYEQILNHYYKGTKIKKIEILSQ
ncbi:SpoIID/LytB domain-containing protein [Prochlorococcus sp. AH-716-D22]|nr:SpoIID/LytB domain-containing protein [Prochlorococcus sp. AH-716-D22]